MKTTHKVIAVSIGFGLFFWVIDAVLDAVFFYQGTLFELLITDVPAHEVYVRLVVMACFLVFGVLLSGGITEREQAEKALRESEERFRDLYENAPNAYFSVGPDGLIHKCNKRAEELFGYAAQELVGYPVFDLYADTAYGKEKALRVLERFRAGETITDEELQMRKADGTPVWISLTVNAVRNAHGRVVESRSMVVDIAERKRAEEELEKRTRDLGERVKELDCLFAISNLVEKQGVLLEEIFAGVVDLVPPAWQYPEITCARILFEGEEFKTENFVVTAWELTGDIIVHGESRGAVQVYYLEERPECDEGPFVKEERALINAISEQLGRIVERMRAEEAVWQHTERLSILYTIDQAILEAQSSEAIAEAALQHIGKLAPCRVAAVTEFDLKANTGITLAQYRKAREISGADETCSTASHFSLEGAQDIIKGLRQGKVQMMADIPSLAPFPPEIQTLDGAGVRSYVSVPLIAQGELVGSLNLGSHRPAAFTSEHVEIAREVAAQLAVALQQTRLHEQVERHAAELERRVAVRTQELRTLYGVAAVASESMDLKVILEQSLERALVALECRAGAIHLLDGANGALEKEALELAVQQGAPPYITSLVQVSAAGNGGLASWVVEHGKALVLSDMSDDVRVSGADRAPGPFPYVGVPMRIVGKVVGALGVVGGEGRQFSAEEVTLLVSIADLVATAVESARLRRQAERALVIEERARLARELHDSVTQLLYSLGLYAETGLELAVSGDVLGMVDYLGRIGRAAQQALKEMRVLIYELRPPVLEDEGLVGALQQRLDTVERRSGVEGILLVEGVLELPVRIESGLYYIAQEALNNALTHAAATSVKVYLRDGNAQVELVVTDNGAGFDPDSMGGMGIIGMRERAEKMGGELTILSVPEEGTKVKVLVHKKQKAGTGTLYSSTGNAI